ncbi:MAG: multiheme c-type cytochrome, partial [Pirellulaceae bacterium]
KRCASCHFEQFMQWKGTPHGTAFSLLTKKYEKDPKCLECHTTGYGEKTGYGAVNDESLQNVGCEVCHGPGSKHEEAAKPFAQVKNLTKEQEELVKGTIWKVQPHNVCLDCHKVQAHGESSTPPEMKKDAKKAKKK